jgi:hypothetical protein
VKNASARATFSLFRKFPLISLAYFCEKRT